jgi:cation:H+ antiporter
VLNRLLFPNNVTSLGLFVELLLAGLVVIATAIVLTRLADRFADERGLGKAFVGMLLLATVTSLPEVVTGATAGAIGSVDMAFGAVFGSCSFNIVIIVIMNLVFAGGGSVLRAARPAQLLSSSFGIVMITLSLLAITSVQKFAGRPVVQQGIESLACVAIVITYMSCMHLIHKFERREIATQEKLPLLTPTSWMIPKLIGVSLITIAAAWWLTQTGDVLAEHPIELLGGRVLGKTVVGLSFLAAATSLPEIATSITAVRINNLDMALGNVFGSNMFNILVLPVVKLSTLATGDSLMMVGANFSANVNILAGLVPVLLTAVAVAGIAYRTQRRVLRLGFDSVVLMVIYVLGMIAILSTGSSPASP